jgi:hypothetical protein
MGAAPASMAAAIRGEQDRPASRLAIDRGSGETMELEGLFGF